MISKDLVPGFFSERGFLLLISYPTAASFFKVAFSRIEPTGVPNLNRCKGALFPAISGPFRRRPSGLHSKREVSYNHPL